MVYINIVLRDMTQNGLQYNLENTKEKPVHKPSQDQSKSSALGGAWNFVEWCHGFQHYCYFRVQDIFYITEDMVLSIYHWSMQVKVN